MNGIRSIFVAVVVWIILSLLGLLLPAFLGLIVFLFVAPIASGYLVGGSKKPILIVAFSIVTSVLAGIIGFATIGYGSSERQINVTEIGWSSDTEILVWVCLNGLLSLAVGFLRLRVDRHDEP